MNSGFAIVCAILFCCGVALSQSIFVSFFVPIILLGFFRRDIVKIALKRLFFLNFFIILVVASASVVGNFYTATLIFARSNIAIFFMVLLFTNRSPYFVADGVAKLKFGDKLASLLYFSVSFVGFVKSELERLKLTLFARGFVPASSLFCYKTYANIVAMLFLSAIARSEALHKSMKARGFSGKFIFTECPLKINLADLSLLSSVILCLIFRIGEII